MKREGLLALGVFLSAGMILWVISCGGGGSGGGGRSLDGDITINIGSTGKNIPLQAEVTWSRAFSVNYNVSGFGGPYTALSMDLQENLAGIDFTPLVAAAAADSRARALVTDTGQMWLYVGRQEDFATVCESDQVYGPFDITLDAGSQPSSVSPATAQATPETMDIINIGAYSVCVKVVSPIDAEVDLNSVGFNIAQCDEAPADISGTWTGTWYCEGVCPIPGPNDITLVITQDTGDPSIATYEDGVAFYEGTVCGNRFSFSGGSTNSSESGTFVMDPGGTTATKTSTYRNYDGPCSGTCYDELTRVD
jgi:hypothetical protein